MSNSIEACDCSSAYPEQCMQHITVLNDPYGRYAVLNEQHKIIRVCSDHIEVSDIPGMVKNLEDCPEDDYHLDYLSGEKIY